MSETKTSKCAIGLTELLTLVFITLKLCHVVNWSWLWVVSPLWIEFLVAVIVLLVIGIIYIIHER